LCGCGEPAWPSMTRWRGLLGSGRAWMGRRAKPHWRKRPSETTRRTGGKKGTKRSLLVDARGAPLSLIVAGANRHDVKLLGATLDGIVVERPKPTPRRPQNLCVDKGYAGKPAEKEMRARGYIPHVPSKGAPKERHRTQGKARRWVVERTHSWMNNYRKLRVRYEKKVANFEGLLHLAIALICWRM
jgi:putative transposase